MPRTPPSTKQMIAFKIGARARKFVLEGCPIEGYELLLTALTESREADPQLHALLSVEMEKLEQRLARQDAEESDL